MVRHLTVPPGLIGPSLLLAGYACSLKCGVALPFVVCTCVAYASGYLPRAFFPPVFDGLYWLYCSAPVGYRIRHIIHPPRPGPHSDYATGVRHLSVLGRFTLPFANRVCATLGEADASQLVGRAPGAAWQQVGAARAEGANGTDSSAPSAPRKHSVGECSHASVSGGVIVVPVPMFTDNYSYLLCSCDRKKCVAVDPADPARVLQMLVEVRAATDVAFELTDVLTTHKHWDHAGGNAELLRLSKQQNSGALDGLVSRDLRVFGSNLDKSHSCTHYVDGGDEIKVAGGGIVVKALPAPGHTHGSIIFVAADAFSIGHYGELLAVFTGDCLFSGGFGAPFETKTSAPLLRTYDVFHSDDIRTNPVTCKRVPDEHVLLYVGHEYTERLLDELVDITKKLVQHPTADKCTKQFHEDVERERAHVKRLRRMKLSGSLPTTTGVESVQPAGSEHVPGRVAVAQSSSTPTPSLLLPCTVPSTLAKEKRINPLLTSVRDELEKLSAIEENDFSTEKLYSTVYMSPHRRATKV